MNDFAALNIDKELIAESGEATGVVELTNGCLCCSLADDTQKEVWRILQGEHPGLASGGIDVDYLVVETSGVADPVSLVASLERRYGKMTRVRLDSVVTVVDADALWHDCVNPGVAPGIAAANQLACADVVLLNKTALLKTSAVAPSTLESDAKAAAPSLGKRGKAAVQSVRSLVTKYAPAAQIYECNYSKVPLPWILDVVVADELGPTVSHEAGGMSGGGRALVMAPSPGLHRVASRTRADAPASASHAHHLRQDGFTSMVYERPGRVFDLTSFQRLLYVRGDAGGLGVVNATAVDAAPKTDGDESKVCDDVVPTSLPVGIVRAKGDVAFEQDARTGGVGAGSFQLSGRCRFEFTLANRDHYIARQRGIRLAIIGRRFKPDHVAALLDSALAPAKGARPASKDGGSTPALVRVVQDLMRDSRFETSVLRCGDSDVVLFRLTCAATYGVSLEELEAVRGIDLDAANDMLARAVNSSRTNAFVTTCRCSGDVFMHSRKLHASTNNAACGGGEEFEDMATCVVEGAFDGDGKTVLALRVGLRASDCREDRADWTSTVWPAINAEAAKIVDVCFQNARHFLCGF